jgi:hypothetical protein
MDEYGTIAREQEWLDAVNARLSLLEPHLRRLADHGVDRAIEWDMTGDLLDAAAEVRVEIHLLQQLREHLNGRIARIRERLD